MYLWILINMSRLRVAGVRVAASQGTTYVKDPYWMSILLWTVLSLLRPFFFFFKSATLNLVIYYGNIKIIKLYNKLLKKRR